MFQLWISLNQCNLTETKYTYSTKPFKASQLTHCCVSCAMSFCCDPGRFMKIRWIDGPIIARRLASTKCAMVQCWKLLWHLRAVALFNWSRPNQPKQLCKSPWFPGSCSLIVYQCSWATDLLQEPLVGCLQGSGATYRNWTLVPNHDTTWTLVTCLTRTPTKNRMIPTKKWRICERKWFQHSLYTTIQYMQCNERGNRYKPMIRTLLNVRLRVPFLLACNPSCERPNHSADARNVHCKAFWRTVYSRGTVVWLGLNWRRVAGAALSDMDGAFARHSMGRTLESDLILISHPQRSPQQVLEPSLLDPLCVVCLHIFHSISPPH